jgi:hypothetical protein
MSEDEVRRKDMCWSMGIFLGSYRAARRRRARPRGGGSLLMVSEATLLSQACVVAVARAWCAWLVWVLSGYTAWHMRRQLTHGRG